MRGLLYLACVLGCALIGWWIGAALVPRGAELETAIYPGWGAIAGGIVGLLIVSAVVAYHRGRDDG